MKGTTATSGIRSGSDTSSTSKTHERMRTRAGEVGDAYGIRWGCLFSLKFGLRIAHFSSKISSKTDPQKGATEYGGPQTSLEIDSPPCKPNTVPPANRIRCNRIRGRQNLTQKWMQKLEGIGLNFNPFSRVELEREEAQGQTWEGALGSEKQVEQLPILQNNTLLSYFSTSLLTILNYFGGPK